MLDSLSPSRSRRCSGFFSSLHGARPNVHYCLGTGTIATGMPLHDACSDVTLFVGTGAGREGGEEAAERGDQWQSALEAPRRRDRLRLPLPLPPLSSETAQLRGALMVATIVGGLAVWDQQCPVEACCLRVCCRVILHGNLTVGVPGSVGSLLLAFDRERN